MPKLFITKNLVSDGIVDGEPWDYQVDTQQLISLQGLSKELRRTTLFKPDYNWNVYSSFCGQNPSQRVAEKNPPILCRALVVDFDAKSELNSVHDFITNLPLDIQPNYIEQTLGFKWRAIWLFEKEILISSSKFAVSFLTKLTKVLAADKALPGYDEASLRATQMWTNGGVWYEIHSKPLPFDLLQGVVVDLLSKKESENFEIPIEKIAEEVEKRFPNRWIGEFVEGARGVRFWDPKADNPKGAYITKYGCHCFTGLKAFVPWEEILGRAWVETNRAINLGNITKGIYHDGRLYWVETDTGIFMPKSREDALLYLTSKGLSNKVPKGKTISDAGSALLHAQHNSRIEAALPILFRPPGFIKLNGVSVLNISRLNIPQPRKDPVTDINEIGPAYKWLVWDQWARRELDPQYKFCLWLSLIYRAALDNKPCFGQALFICGPKDTGKTLLACYVIGRMLGGKIADPYNFLLRRTTFNSELMASPLLVMNDKAVPNEEERSIMTQGIKSFVVNDRHMFNKKFCDSIDHEWHGRFVNTLNDDSKSVGILPDQNDSTKDKMMFFATRPRPGGFPSMDQTKKEFDMYESAFGRWLYDFVNICPEKYFQRDRMGVVSHYDPVILDLSRQQEPSYNLLEIIRTWQREGAFWINGDSRTWEGTPTDLLTQLSDDQSLHAALKDWNVFRVAKALSTLSRLGNMHVKAVEKSKNRLFRIERFVDINQEIIA